MKRSDNPRCSALIERVTTCPEVALLFLDSQE